MSENEKYLQNISIMEDKGGPHEWYLKRNNGTFHQFNSGEQVSIGLLFQK